MPGLDPGTPGQATRGTHTHSDRRRHVDKRVRAVVDGATRRIWVCTRCIRDGKVEKPAARTWQPEVTLCAWLMLRPMTVFLLQIAHCLAMSS